MGVLSELEPKNVFKYFEEICSIPHPSYHEKKISDYLVNFAKEHNLEYYQDDLYNVVMIKEASAGYEAQEPVIIQGHMDMVCEKEPGCAIDFENDPLELMIEGDYITAKGTTLGGDDGIAVAYALALLDDDSLEHPRLEVVITVSEETGMEGAAGVDLSMLKGHKLLNLDSEDEGIMLASCAGGSSAIVALPVNRETKTGTGYEIHVTGLKGGHSGTEIDKGRANSNLLSARVLLGLHEQISVVEMAGGSKQNAIPRETKALVIVESGKEKDFEEAVRRCEKEISHEFSTPDPDIRIELTEKGSMTAEALDKTSVRKVTVLLHALPNGIQGMSNEIPGLVETSLNLGIMRLEAKELHLEYALRSSVATARKYLEAKVKAVTEEIGGTVEIASEYPAWEYKKDSAFREDVIRVYEKMYGKAPVIQAIHAGVECGILAGKIKDLDGVSMGPDMSAIHTTEEKLSISSARRVYEYVVELLKCKSV